MADVRNVFFYPRFERPTSLSNVAMSSSVVSETLTCFYIYALLLFSLRHQVSTIGILSNPCGRILNTGDHYRYTAQNPVSVYDILSAIRKSRLSFLGHILRIEPDRPLKETLFCLST